MLELFWLNTIVQINPLHHLAEGLRQLLLNGKPSWHLAAAAGLCLALLAVLIPLDMRLLRKRVPLLIELLSLGVEWLGWILLLTSILSGIYKIACAIGLIEETKGQREKKDKQRKMDHYYFHCERNPDGFERLKLENFEKDLLEHTRKEAASIQKSEGS